MGTRSLPLISFPPPADLLPSINPRSTVYQRSNFFSELPSSSGVRAVPRAQWDTEAETIRSERFGSGSKFDVDDRSEFRSREKRRRWWSDEDEDTEEEEEEDDGDGGDGDGLFGLWQEPKTIDLVLKVLGTVGWIMPNIIMSSMLDTGNKGQDAFFMALMIPLGQVAISFVVDRIQGSSGNASNPRTKRKKKPFARSTSRTKRGNKTRKRSYRTSQERAAYIPWWETDSNFSKNGAKSSSKFGGWDELDQQVDNVSDFHGLSPREDDNLKEESKVQIE